MAEQSTKVTIPKARLSYANVHVPVKAMDSEEEKYSCSVLWPKTDKKTTEAVQAAIKAAAAAALATKWEKVAPKTYKDPPLRDGDEKFEEDPEKYKAYKGMYYVAAKSKEKPTLLGKDKKEIASKTDIYSGCYCHVSVNFYGFKMKGNKGIAVGLNGLMKFSDGEALAGRGNVVADFDGYEANTDEDQDF